MPQQPGAREMLQEVHAQPGTLRGTLDQPGNIGDHKAAVSLQTDHAQMRMQGGEGVVRHPRGGR